MSDAPTPERWIFTREELERLLQALDQVRELHQLLKLRGFLRFPAGGIPVVTPEQLAAGDVPPAPPRPPQPQPRVPEPVPLADGELLVTLDQAAAAVARSKRTLEKYRRKMPPPYAPGGGGRPALWLYSALRPWLEATFRVRLDPSRPARVRV